MELDPPEKAVLEKWGTEDALYEFLHERLNWINQIGFENKLSIPRIQVKPQFLSEGAFGEYLGSNAAGDYNPPDKNRPAEIGIFSSVLINENLATVVLAHELVHHWHATQNIDDALKQYPYEIDEMIKIRFGNPVKETSWRHKHPNEFIAKAIDVAERSKIDKKIILFG